MLAPPFGFMFVMTALFRSLKLAS